MKKIKSFIDRIYLKRKFSVKEKYWVILFFNLVAYIYLIFSKLPSPDNHFTICIFKNITGYPCAACGTTRGLKHFVRGNFHEALIMNPLSYFTILVSITSIIWIIRDLLKKEETLFPFINKKLPIPLIILVIILTALNWYWNIVKDV